MNTNLFIVGRHQKSIHTRANRKCTAKVGTYMTKIIIYYICHGRTVRFDDNGQ